MPRSDYNVNINLKTTDKTSPAVKKAGGALGMLGKAATVAAAAMVALKVAQGAIKFAKFGGKVQRAADSLGFLAKQAGTTSTQIVGAMQKASGFTIDRMTAMSAANKALLLEVAKTPDQFAELAKQATILGRAMGKDAASSIDLFISAAGRQSTKIADDLGLIIDLSEVYGKYAARLGTTADQLSKTQQQQAFLSEMLTQAKKKTVALEGSTGGLATQNEQLAAAWSDVKADAAQVWASLVEGSGIVTTLTELLGYLNIALGRLFPEALGKADRAMEKTTERTEAQKEAWLSFADVTQKASTTYVQAQTTMASASSKSTDSQLLDIQRRKTANQRLMMAFVARRDPSTGKRVMVERGSTMAQEWQAAQHGTRSALGGMTLVGEGGPEMVNMRPGARVFNNQQTSNMFNQTVHTQATQSNVMNDFALASALAG